MKRFLLTFFILVFVSGMAFGQVGDRVEKLTPSDLENYARPIATWIGTYFNSGGYHSAELPNTFGFKFSLIGMYIFIPDDQKTFSPNLPAGYTNTGETATFFGDKGGVYPGPGGFLVYPPGINVTSVPAGIPQIAASLMGTEVMLRFIPKVKIEDVETQLFGIGITHSISRYIPKLPIDLAVQIMYSNFSANSPEVDFSTSNLAFNAHASKSFSLLTLYGGLQYESSSLDIDYTYFGDSVPATNIQNGTKYNISIDGDNNFRLTLGAALELAVLVLHTDYNIGSQSVWTFGLSLEF